MSPVIKHEIGLPAVTRYVISARNCSKVFRTTLREVRKSSGTSVGADKSVDDMVEDGHQASASESVPLGTATVTGDSDSGSRSVA